LWREGAPVSYASRRLSWHGSSQLAGEREAEGGAAIFSLEKLTAR